jgi:hypothetical protein
MARGCLVGVTCLTRGYHVDVTWVSRRCHVVVTWISRGRHVYRYNNNSINVVQIFILNLILFRLFSMYDRHIVKIMNIIPLRMSL